MLRKMKARRKEKELEKLSRLEKTWEEFEKLNEETYEALAEISKSLDQFLIFNLQSSIK